MLPEGTNVEYKELEPGTGKITEKVLREVIAFLNTDGGDIYIGIRDDRSIAGVDDPDDVMNRLSNMIGDSILPNAMAYIRITPMEMEGKPIVRCSVSMGVERPYFLRGKGLTPDGVFVRVGASCRNVNEGAIRAMIVESSGMSYEERRSLNQELTFETMLEEMNKRSLRFDLPQMKTLKMVGKDGLYTNLALLLSDQCPFVTKVAVFDGTFFKDRQIFEGSLFKQLNDVYRFLKLNNRTAATFQDLLRTDVQDYPPEALREALLNSMVHRSYSLSDGNIINIRENRVEVISLGGLVPEISYNAIFMGISQSRNPNLAGVFYRMQLIESYGTGIQKIFAAYETYDCKPEIQTAEGAFKIVLPNVNASRIGSETALKETGLVFGSDDAKEKVRSLLREKGSITRMEAEEALGLGTTRTYTILKELCKTGEAVQVKEGKKSRYVRA